jgi:hypothetical protein
MEMGGAGAEDGAGHHGMGVGHHHHQHGGGGQQAETMAL